MRTWSPTPADFPSRSFPRARSTDGVASSGSPSGRPSSFRWLSRPRGCAELRTLDFRRLLSTPARPVANSPSRIGVVSFSSTGCVPPTRAGCSALPADRRRSFSTRVERSLLRQGRQSTSDSHRRRPLARLAQPPARAGCCSCPPAGSTSDLHRLFHPPASPTVNRSTFVEQSILRLGL